MGWFVGALLPVMPIRPTSLYLYMPLVGLALLIGAAYQRSRRRVFAVWLMLWIVIGCAGNLFTQRYLARAWRVSNAQVATLERWIRARGARRLVTIDTPVLQYALPAAIALRAPDLRFETWYVNFVPRLDRRVTSRLAWRGDRVLEITAGPEGFLGSQFERFLAFGGSPFERHASAGPVVVELADRSPNPRRLRVSFADAASRDETLIVQFVQDTLSIVEGPGRDRPAAHATTLGALIPEPATRASAPTR
jgi:hypothetical protein